MRPLEIEVECCDNRINELLGDDVYDVTRAYIDLDRVSYVWDDPNGHIVVHFNNSCIRTRTYTYDEFVALWANETVSINQ